MNSEVLRIDSREVEYCLSKGKAHTVVLINGSGGPWISWSGVWDLLEPQVNVLAYNRPGIGKSTRASEPQTMKTMASDVRKLLLTLGVADTVTVVGHSLGGLIALQYCLDYPQSVNGLVLLEPSTFWDISHQKSLPEDKKDLNSELNYVSEGSQGLETLDDLPDVPAVVGMGTKTGLLSWLFRQQMTQRRSHLRKLAGAIQGCTIAEFGKSGHFPQITEPRRVAETILQTVENALVRRHG